MILNSTEQHCSPPSSSTCTRGSLCPVSTTAYAAIFRPAGKIVWHCGCFKHFSFLETSQHSILWDAWKRIQILVAKQSQFCSVHKVKCELC